MAGQSGRKSEWRESPSLRAGNETQEPERARESQREPARMGRGAGAHEAVGEDDVVLGPRVQRH
eukprot:COSAG04_NODE_23234_length_341_cov_1.694215_1_plen_63_part_01